MKDRRKLKGMTLAEVLVALAVFAMLALILLTYGVYVDKTRRATTNLKERIVTEDHYAASKKTKYGEYTDPGDPSNGVPAKTVEKKLKKKSVDGKTDLADQDEPSLNISVSMKADGYYFPLIDPNDPTKGYSDEKKKYTDPSIGLQGDLYSTKEIFRDGKDDDELKVIDNSANKNHDLKFIDHIAPQPTSEPGT